MLSRFVAGLDRVDPAKATQSLSFKAHIGFVWLGKGTLAVSIGWSEGKLKANWDVITVEIGTLGNPGMRTSGP
jgi:hypothetical protein